MRRELMAAATIAIAATLVASVARAEVFVYPKKGQSQQQFQQDQFQCHGWAKQQTGVTRAGGGHDRPGTGGGGARRCRGAPSGRSAAPSGCGKGAAISAAVSGTGGAMRQGKRNRSGGGRQQAQVQQQTNLQRYEGLRGVHGSWLQVR
jgi:hypothetical protein